MQHGEKTSTSVLCWVPGFLGVTYCCCTTHPIILSYLDYLTPVRITLRNTENKTRHFKVQKQGVSTFYTSDFKVHSLAIHLRCSWVRPYSKNSIQFPQAMDASSCDSHGVCHESCVAWSDIVCNHIFTSILCVFLWRSACWSLLVWAHVKGSVNDKRTHEALFYTLSHVSARHKRAVQRF